jgi:hypothetical protein
MFRRLRNYYVIGMAFVYVWLVHGFISRTTAVSTGVKAVCELLNLGFVLIIVTKAVLRLLKERRTQIAPASTPAPNLRTATALRNLFSPIDKAAARHPIRTPLFASLFLLIPFTLYALGTPGGWRGFQSSDWKLVAFAELPLLVVLVYAVIASRRSKRV